MPSTALVIYASTHGHTAKIAERIAVRLREHDLAVTVARAGSGAVPDPDGFGLVIAGASVHKGKHQGELIDWAREHAGVLNAMPSAFFSSSLSAAEDTAESREANSEYLAAFATETGWTPTATAIVAGALQYLEYDFFTRTLMRLMMRRGNHPTDTSRDWEYTDWNAVDAFAGEIAALVREREPTPA